VSIVVGSGALGIENTARAQLRLCSPKMGAHRQADLTRMILTSLIA
jgi:hypothetical protein